MKKVKHSFVTDDYIADEKIQDKNWKYFVENLLTFSQDGTSSDSKQQILIDTEENLVILKKNI